MRLNEVTSCHMMLHEVTLVLMRPAKACGVTWGWLRSHGVTWRLGHMRLVYWGSVRSTEVTKVTVHRSAEVTWSQMLGECCRLCLDVVHLLKSKRKVLNKGLILNYMPLLVSAHLPYMSWIRICYMYVFKAQPNQKLSTVLLLGFSRQLRTILLLKGTV